MDLQTLVWANSVLVLIIGGLLTILGFFVKGWMAKTEERLALKLDTTLCGERHDATLGKCEDLSHHRHAPSYQDGRGGEVIFPS